MTTKIQLPIVHLNGSGRESLMRQYHNAYMKLQEAIVALREVDTHDRDFYPLGPDAGPQARLEQRARETKLAEIQGEMLQLYSSVEP